MASLFDASSEIIYHTSDQDDVDSDVSTEPEEFPPTCSVQSSPEVLPSTSATFVPLPPAQLIEPVRKRISCDLLFTGAILTVSSAILMILFPAYTAAIISIGHGGNLSSVIFISTTCVICLCVLSLICSKMKCFAGILFLKRPDKPKVILYISFTYTIGALVVIFSQDDSRVPCHLQDPLKAIVVLFSLLYYFFFCRKMLGIRKIFAAAVIAIGLFVASDYGLCDEYKCRGNKSTRSEFNETWESRIGWTFTYLIGLAIFTFHYTLVEEFVVDKNVPNRRTRDLTEILSTVSKIVSRDEDCDRLRTPAESEEYISSQIVYAEEEELIEPEENNNTILKKSAVQIALWVQGTLWIFMIVISVIFIITAKVINNGLYFDSTISELHCHLFFFTLEKQIDPSVPSVPTLPDALPTGRKVYYEDDFVTPVKKVFRKNMKKEAKRKLALKQNRNVAPFNFSAYHNIRKPRNAEPSKTNGFTIIQPTKTALDGHIIKSKLKSELIGHVILNKTNVNIMGYHVVTNDEIMNTRPKKFIKNNDDLFKRFKRSPYERKPKKKIDPVDEIRRQLQRERLNDPEPDNEEIPYKITNLDIQRCSYIPFYGWTVSIAYVAFSISSIRFLILCQSSVFTISVMTLALPITVVWWAFFTQKPDGSLSVQLRMSGELICALLGFPVVILGLILFLKAHLKQNLLNLRIELQSNPSPVQTTNDMADIQIPARDSVDLELGTGVNRGRH